MPWLAGNTDGDLDQALEYSLTALKLSPNSGACLDTLAHVYFARGQFKKAVETQEKAVRYEPHSGLIVRKLEVFRKKLAEQPGGEKPDGPDDEGPSQE